ncbi:related to LTE1 GDP/GTP exchange factor [Cephalotrichum gorgonifer]|uniref:Related to LTE1 GDP/GTP exchange factor n=1 Tax=Cephalotrichum gorgonifer TaxID=2041049 RepID=A0AAE8SW33_9PEZI|nr:related to LTE1 GDP/GTP exchange factor [Cephalotrichum gorgonifer]
MEAPEGARPLASHPPISTDLAAGQPPRESEKRTPRSPAQDVRSARNILLAAGREPVAGGRGGRVTRQPSGTARPLVPVNERKSQEESAYTWRIKRDGDGDKTDITPDGGSAGREGRQFTVANVGNNGRIYLRPTIRPAHQRPPQPNFVFPVTPPSTAGLDNLTTDKRQNGNGGSPTEGFGSSWGSSHAPSPAVRIRRMSSTAPQSRRRALSDSTVREAAANDVRELDDGTFKVVISKPAEEPRPKTMEDMEPEKAPVLDINIPSWKMGRPRFTTRGSPMFRDSSYAPTDEFGSSRASFLNKSFPQSSLLVPSRVSSRPPIRLSVPSMQLSSNQPSSSPIPPKLSFPMRGTYLSTHLVIEPDMFDDLTFKPACDDRALVRYSPVSGAVTAATPPRLVAEITSPSFLDYELISDFFLTFRAFLEPADLVRMMFARLRWAIERGDETGMVVRVRTFVALRHWILNYFVDDFVMEYGLRVTFCNLLNDIMDDLHHDDQKRKIHFKILSELKKCWRRICAQYWDGAEFDASLGGDVPIAPGGLAGHPDPDLDPSQWEAPDLALPHLDASGIHEREFGGLPSDAPVVDRPGTPDFHQEMADELARQQQASPTSLMSVDVVSCSFPAKSLRNLQAGANMVHPVPVNPIHAHTGMVAMTPKALVGKRIRPMHKRNGSITDSMRDNSIDRAMFKDAVDVTLPVPYSGSLVRGDLLPPGHAFVDVLPPSALGDAQRETTFLHADPHQSEKERSSASAMSGQGMRRLIGSVRRALSTRDQGMSATQGNFINISPIGPRGATTNRLPGTAIVPQARPRLNGARPPVRIDLLGAEIAEDFKKAVREGAAAEAAAEEAIQRALLRRHSARQSAGGEGGFEYSAAHLDSSFENLPKPSRFRPTSEMAITTGSKSIVIFDETAFDLDMLAMTGALPAVNPSLEAFAETFNTNGGDPTPPTTPPGRPMGTPRRSSFLFNQHMKRASMSSDPLPPFIPDMATLGRDRYTSDRHHSYVPSHTSMDRSTRNDAQPTSTTGPRLWSNRFHNRQKSHKTIPSMSSVLHRRATSFNSGPRTHTIRSFDATTDSGCSVMDGPAVDDPDVSPAPLRVLRRRPGGNLGEARTVRDLKAPLRHSRSVGSLTTYSESLRSSFMQQRDSSGFVDIVSSDFSPENAETFSLGAMAQKANKRHLSLFSTHSSRPAMRPSFEAEARKLAQIPDDTDDEGGPEAALLKLEGRYEKKSSKTTPEPRESSPPDLDTIGMAVGEPPATADDKHEHRDLEIGAGDDRFLHHRHSGVPEPSSDVHGNLLGPNTDARSFLSTEASYSSVPLLERGLSDDGGRLSTQEWANISILRGPDDETPTMTERGDKSYNNSHRPSFELVEETDSVKRVKSEEDITRPDHESEGHSFLDDGSDDGGGSDLSSELSAEDAESDYYGLGGAGPTSPRHGFVLKPSGHDVTSTANAPPSPPMTLGQALQMSPETAYVPQLHEHQLFAANPHLPTPDTTPTTDYRPGSAQDADGMAKGIRGSPKTMSDPEMSRKYSAHLPFILAFDSEILAQQFTLIEKDALNEIDWKELIDMGWKNATNNDSRSWVEFLRNTDDARGVEVVIARFNIMVKWAVSEIVLTQDIEERARCLIKFVHIATHCRRYRNFATMAQVVVALSSQEVARLSRTWALVPPRDLATFRGLEQLVSPTKNFYALRAEMEGGSGAGAWPGCIPFVGIYTHDLLFNAQRPSEIASSPTTAPLVNFERCRCAAAVVKTLLRLLEESAGYDFKPVEGITERCLWMSALTDEEIRAHSERLE